MASLLSRMTRLRELQQASPVEPEATGLTQNQRLARWVKMVRRFLFIDAAMQSLWRATAVMSERTAKNFMEWIGKDNTKLRNDEEEAKRVRVIAGEAVGRTLVPSTSTKHPAELAPAECPHATENMVRRSNKQRTWWTCKKCHSRWERYILKEPGMCLLDSDILPFGKHAGLTYQHVLQNYPGYCAWIVDTAKQDHESSPQLLRFEKYLHREAGDMSDDLNSEDWESLPPPTSSR